jgi:hypothetical protein
MAAMLLAMVPLWGDPPATRLGIPAPPMVLIDDDPSVQMRGKLTRSKEILAGLVRRDFASISRAATELKRISAATDWPRAEDAEFKHLSADFQRQCDQLDSLARELNFDGVQVTFQSLTLTCIRCHDHLRDGP